MGCLRICAAVLSSERMHRLESGVQLFLSHPDAQSPHHHSMLGKCMRDIVVSKSVKVHL